MQTVFKTLLIISGSSFQLREAAKYCVYNTKSIIFLFILCRFQVGLEVSEGDSEVISRTKDAKKTVK